VAFPQAAALAVPLEWAAHCEGTARTKARLSSRDWSLKRENVRQLEKDGKIKNHLHKRSFKKKKEKKENSIN